MTHVIAQPCIGTKSADCVEVCPVDCIYEADDQFYIHPQECIDCGACVSVCPVDAIFPAAEVPSEWNEFEAKNAELAKQGVGKGGAKASTKAPASNAPAAEASNGGEAGSAQPKAQSAAPADDGPEAVLREARKPVPEKPLEKPPTPQVRTKAGPPEKATPASRKGPDAKDPSTWDPTRNLPISAKDEKAGQKPAPPPEKEKPAKADGAEPDLLEAAARALEAAAAVIRAAAKQRR